MQFYRLTLQMHNTGKQDLSYAQSLCINTNRFYGCVMTSILLCRLLGGKCCTDLHPVHWVSLFCCTSQQVGIFHILNHALEEAQWFIEYHRHCDLTQLLPNTVLQNRPDGEIIAAEHRHWQFLPENTKKCTIVNHTILITACFQVYQSRKRKETERVSQQKWITNFCCSVTLQIIFGCGWYKIHK